MVFLHFIVLLGWLHEEECTWHVAYTKLRNAYLFICEKIQRKSALQ